MKEKDEKFIINKIKKGSSVEEILCELLKRYSNINTDDLEKIESLSIKEQIDKLSENSSIDAKIAKNEINALLKKYKALRGFEKLHDIKKVIAYLEAFHPTLIRNEITGKIQINGKEQSESSLNTICLEAEIFGTKMNKTKFYDILNSNLIPSHHPLKDFFLKSEYKGKGELEKFLRSIESPTGNKAKRSKNAYLKLFMVKWLIGNIASLFGSYNNLMLILTGGQNVGKTRLIRDLLPSEIKDFLAEASFDQKLDKDSAILLCESLIVFDDDLGSKSFLEWHNVKKMLDTNVFSIRRPYGRGNERMKRLASFCGTSNEYELIGDPTGNRRIIPIEIESIDFDLLNSVEKSQMWLEVYHEYYLKGFKHELTQEEIRFLNESTVDYTITDPVKESIVRFFSVPKIDNNLEQTTLMSATEIADHIKFHTGRNIQPRSLGVRLKNLGFVQKIVKVNNSTQRKYEVVKNENI